MPVITEQTFRPLYETHTPAEAASVILTAHHGSARKAERDVWDTWNVIVGGHPGARPAEGAIPEADFCVAVVSAIVEGREQPPVERA